MDRALGRGHYEREDYSEEYHGGEALKTVGSDMRGIRMHRTPFHIKINFRRLAQPVAQPVMRHFGVSNLSGVVSESRKPTGCVDRRVINRTEMHNLRIHTARRPYVHLASPSLVRLHRVTPRLPDAVHKGSTAQQYRPKSHTPSAETTRSVHFLSFPSFNHSTISDSLTWVPGKLSSGIPSDYR